MTFLDDTFQVAAELSINVVRRLYGNVLAVVAKVENDDVVAIEEQPPIGEIGVGRETVAMRQQDARALSGFP